jgi:RNA polymerase sigma factor FliA
MPSELSLLESFELTESADIRARAAVRDALAVKYHPYVYKVAREVAARFRTPLEVDDLAGWGCLGLLEAAERFRPERGVRFRSFAHARIRGAMIDAIRASFGRRTAGDETETTNGTRRPRRLLADGGYPETMAESGREPHDRALGTRLEISSASQDRLILQAESRREIELALRALTTLERTIIVQHYLKGEDICAIARRHGFSKSWLSRVHKRAILKLRAAMKDRSKSTTATRD